MFDAIGFLTSRTGILLVSALVLTSTLVWGYQQKVGRMEAENRLVQGERDYQARMAAALEQQRKALDTAILEERQRRVALEQKWKSIGKVNRKDGDYEKPASASIINTLNSLSSSSASR